MDKILFLDIDGVLNCNGWNESHQKEISDGKRIDQEKVKLLGKLIRSTKAKIVLHSGWRFWFDSDIKPLREEALNLVRLLEKQKIAIYDMTPDLTTEEIRATKRFSLVKAQEILAWLDMHKDVEDWVVLDDLDLKNEVLESHQVRTDPAVGLTKEDSKAAEKLLSQPIETFEELYRKLRVHDRESRIAKAQEDTFVLRLEQEYRINVYDNIGEVYLEIAHGESQCTHFHPDYREAYDYLVEVLEQPDAVVEEMEEAVKKAKGSQKAVMIFTALFLISIFVLLLAADRYPDMSGIVILPVLLLDILLSRVLTKVLHKCRKPDKTDGGQGV